MHKYILKRLLMVIPTLIGVSLLVFLMIHMIPGDPAQVMLYPKGTPEEVEILRHKLGLDKPLITQYFDWVINVLHFNLGSSVKSGETVIAEIFTRFPATIELSLAALMIAVVSGIPLGVLAARKKNSIIDYFCISISLLGVSIPVFWLGLMLIFIFSATLGILPVSGRITMGGSIADITGLYVFDSLLSGDLNSFVDALRHLVLPAISLTTIPLALVVRITRSSMLDVLSQDYIRTAKAKGIPNKLVVYKHALKNALIPVVTVIGLQLGTLLGGAILTETVFSWPGIGMLIVSSIGNRDYPVIQGIVFVIAFLMIVVNLVVDILYAYIDPRIRY
ncbi:MAG: ABC transporter permease [Eubacteriales bacterium]